MATAANSFDFLANIGPKAFTRRSSKQKQRQYDHQRRSSPTSPLLSPYPPPTSPLPPTPRRTASEGVVAVAAAAVPVTPPIENLHEQASLPISPRHSNNNKRRHSLQFGDHQWRQRHLSIASASSYMGDYTTTSSLACNDIAGNNKDNIPRSVPSTSATPYSHLPPSLVTTVSNGSPSLSLSASPASSSPSSLACDTAVPSYQRHITQQQHYQHAQPSRRNRLIFQDPTSHRSSAAVEPLAIPRPDSLVIPASVAAPHHQAASPLSSSLFPLATGFHAVARRPGGLLQYWLRADDVLRGVPGRAALPPGHWDRLVQLAREVTLCSPIRHRRQGEKMLASEPAEGETTTATTTTTGKASNVEQLLTGWCNVGEHLHPEGDENMDEFDYDQQWLRHVLQGQT